MDACRPDRVVDLDPIEEHHGEDNDHSGDRTDQDRSRNGHIGGAGGDADEAGEAAVKRHADVRLAEEEPGGDRRRERRCRRRGVRVDSDLGSQSPAVTGNAHRAPRIEAEPAEPEDETADEGQRHVVTRNRLDTAVGGVLSDPRPEDHRPGQRSPAPHRMHRRTSGEVPEPLLGQEPTPPDPVPGDRIDHHRHEEAEEDEGVVLDPLGDGAGDDRRGRSGENELEEKLRPQRHASPTDRAVGPGVFVSNHRAVVGAADHEGAGVSNPSASIGAEHQIPAEEPESDRRGGEDDEVLRENVDAILGPGEARLDTPEAEVHEEHEHPGDQDPDGVRGEPQIRDHLLGRRERRGRGGRVLPQGRAGERCQQQRHSRRAGASED